MSRTLQFKRYANTVVANTTGASGEIIIDTTNKLITIHDGVTKGGFVGGSADSTARAAACTAQTTAQAAYNYANTIVSDTQIDQTARTTANTASNNITIIQGVNTSQNTRIGVVEGVDVGQNTRITIIENINVSQNANVVLLQSGLNTANANTIYLQGGLNTANANTVYLQSGLNSANANIALLQGAMTTANSSINAAAQTIPQNAQTVNYTLQLTDAGKHIYYTQASNTILYIPTTSNVAFSNGSTIMIVSRTSSSANVTVSPNTGVTMYLAGNTTSASRNVTTYGMATLIQVAANTWFINGTGVS